MKDTQRVFLLQTSLLNYRTLALLTVFKRADLRGHHNSDDYTVTIVLDTVGVDEADI